VKIQPRLLFGSLGLMSLLLVTGCASSGPGPEPMPTSAAPAVAVPAMRELYEAGDYAATVRVFLADPALANQDLAVFRAAIASAMSGHAEHDAARALTLFNRLVAEFPESDYMTEARLLVSLLEATEALSDQNERLKQELDQMKAIDLGQQP